MKVNMEQQKLIYFFGGILGIGDGKTFRAVKPTFGKPYVCITEESARDLFRGCGQYSHLYIADLESRTVKLFEKSLTITAPAPENPSLTEGQWRELEQAALTPWGMW